MEIEVDLLAKKRSIIRIIFGLLVLVYIVFLVLREEEVSDYFGLGVFGLIAWINLIEGYGYSPQKVFGKAFILINNNVIVVKTKVRRKAISICWDKIASINFRYTELLIKKKDSSGLSINTKDLSYETQNEIKEVIIKIASEKEVKYRLH